ncbi:UL16-binding protein 1-like [Chionomys nivalis]|uniref:UL16-binding protein 1-like n=1 Tax=Chionomys nivalis TaxID=269649 RepID=UPI002593B6FA|nr:UL16-binding protein 1-like [Chionomys nivalis]
MARNAAAQNYPSTKVLCFWVLLICLWSMLPITDAASLCYNFTVGKSEYGPWWHKVQGQLNEETFITCDSNNNCNTTGLLRDKLNATKPWKEQAVTLKDGINRFKQQVIDMKQETNTIRGIKLVVNLWNLGHNYNGGPGRKKRLRSLNNKLELEAGKYCWHEVDGHFNGSWDFDLNGHKVAHVDSSTGEWTEVDPGSRWMKEMWEKNKDFTAFLKMTSQGDWKTWLEEFKSHCEEKL